MEFILVTVGAVLRTLFLVVTNEVHPLRTYFVTGAFFLGILFAALEGAWFILPLTYALTAAFVFKEQLLRKVTEGTLLLYGLVALFIHTQYTANGVVGHLFENMFFLFLCVYTLAFLVLCVLKVRLTFTLRALAIVCYLLVSLYIAFRGTLTLLVADTSPFGLLLLGFFGLQFAANLLYVLLLLPVQSSDTDDTQTPSQEAIMSVRAHAADLERAYTDVDLHLLRTIGIVVLFALTPFYSYVFGDWFTAAALMLLVGSVLADPTALRQHQVTKA